MPTTKKGGAKLSRSETVTVRLDPKLRYLAELASRKQRRTLSSFIEWVIEDSLKREYIHYENNDQNVATFFDAAGLLWDVNEVDRFLLLAKNFPDLLNHDEQVLWKLIREINTYDPQSKYVIEFYSSKNKQLNITLIRTCWQELKGVVNGSVSEAILKKAMYPADIPF